MLDGSEKWLTAFTHCSQTPGSMYRGFVKDIVASPLKGRRAPDFTLPRTGYQAFSLSDVRGRPAILVGISRLLTAYHLSSAGKQVKSTLQQLPGQS